MVESKASVIGTKLAAALETFNVDRNTILDTEFEAFLPLFQEDKAGISSARYAALCEEYRSRISLHSPVRIVNNRDELLFRLPPAFSTVQALDAVFPDAGQLIAYFAKACQDNHALRDDKERSGALLTIAFAKANEENHVDNLAIVTEIEEEFDSLQNYTPDEYDMLDTLDPEDEDLDESTDTSDMGDSVLLDSLF